MSALLRVARRISPARFDADSSYLGTRLAGDRWVAVGDAAAFLDPIFSTGVLLAMQSGLDAAAATRGSRAGTFPPVTSPATPGSSAGATATSAASPSLP